MGTKAPAVTPTPAQDAAALAAHQAQVARRRAARGYPEVGWNLEECQPPSPEYLTRDSYLLVNVFPTTAGGVVTVAARILLPNGKINNCLWTVGPTVGLTKLQAVEPLVEGFLLSLTVSITPVAAPTQRGDTYVQVMLQYGPAPAVNCYRTLVSDYVTTTRTVGWPEGPLNDNLSGPGFLQTHQTANPAAGADFNFTTPANTRTWVHALTATLTTSSTAANRLVNFQIKDTGTNLIWSFGSQVAQVASTVYVYNASECIVSSSAASVTMLVTFPSEMYLLPGDAISSLTTNLQSGDQWSAIEVLWETWVLF